MYLYNGKKIEADETILDSAGTQYPPSSWLSRMDELGITVVADPVYPDAELFDVVENDDGTITSTEKPLAVILAVMLKRYKDAVQVALDTKAQEREYDGILSLCSYVNSANPTFAAEGAAGDGWRDAAWAYCYQVRADVENNLRPMPTVEELVAELPAMAWPA